MKKIFFVVLCSVITWSVSAQEKPWQFGIRGGFNSTTVKMKNLQFENSGQRSNAEIGYIGGLFARYNANKHLFIEPGVEWSRRQVNVQNTPKDNKFRTFSIDVPVMVGTNVLTMPMFRWRAYTGPAFSFIYNDPVFYGYGNKEFKPDTFMPHWRLGTGFDMWKVGLDFYYEQGLKKFGEGIKAPRGFNVTVSVFL